ncbi:MAG: DUF4149 domain-containing protein [Acidobacteriota bacterium]
MNRSGSGFSSGIRLLLLSAWLGAAIFFSAIVAPAAFSALRSFQVTNVNEIAGAIVNRALAVVNVSGFLISLAVLALTLSAERKNMKMPVIPSSIALLLMASATAVGHWVIAARMRGLRLAMVTIDLVPLDDPRRVAFSNLHRYSVISLMLAMLAAIVAIVLTGFRPLSGAGKPSS